MAPFVTVIRLNANGNPANWNNVVNGHGRYDPDDMRTKTIGDLKTWICHECHEFDDIDEEEIDLGYALPDEARPSNDDDTLLWKFILFGNFSNELLPNDDAQSWNLFQTLDEKARELYVWQKTEAWGHIIDQFGGAKNVFIESDRIRKVICPEPGRTARQFYKVTDADKRIKQYKLTSFNKAELYLFIEDLDGRPDPNTPNTVHSMLKFKIPRTTNQVSVKSDTTELPELKGTFTLECRNTEGAENPDKIIPFKEGVSYPFDDDENRRVDRKEKYVDPNVDRIVGLVSN